MDEMLTHAVVCQLKHKMPLINRLVDPGPDFWSNSIPKLAFLKGRIRIQNSFFFNSLIYIENCMSKFPYFSTHFINSNLKCLLL